MEKGRSGIHTFIEGAKEQYAAGKEARYALGQARIFLSNQEGILRGQLHYGKKDRSLLEHYLANSFLARSESMQVPASSVHQKAKEILLRETRQNLLSVKDGRGASHLEGIRAIAGITAPLLTGYIDRFGPLLGKSASRRSDKTANKFYFAIGTMLMGESEKAIIKNHERPYDEFIFYGPLGRAAYEEDERKRIESKFGEHASPQAKLERLKMWEDYSRAQCLVLVSGEQDVLKATRDAFRAINPRADEELAEGNEANLGRHLKEAHESARKMYLTKDGKSRFPTILTDRQAVLLVDGVIPFHDLLKYAGSPAAEEFTADHQALLRDFFAKIIPDKPNLALNGKLEPISQEEISFIAAVAGRHENIFHEKDWINLISSETGTERARALMMLTDVLTKIVIPSSTEGEFTIDEKQLTERFEDLYFRQIDLVTGKVFRPEWGPTTVNTLLHTLQLLQEKGDFHIITSDGQDYRELLINAAIHGIERAFARNLDRVTYNSSHPEELQLPVFDLDQRLRVAIATNQLYSQHWEITREKRKAQEKSVSKDEYGQIDKSIWLDRLGTKEPRDITIERNFAAFDGKIGLFGSMDTWREEILPIFADVFQDVMGMDFDKERDVFDPFVAHWTPEDGDREAESMMRNPVLIDIILGQKTAVGSMAEMGLIALFGIFRARKTLSLLDDILKRENLPVDKRVQYERARRLAQFDLMDLAEDYPQLYEIFDGPDKLEHLTRASVEEKKRFVLSLLEPATLEIKLPDPIEAKDYIVLSGSSKTPGKKSPNASDPIYIFDQNGQPALSRDDILTQWRSEGYSFGTKGDEERHDVIDTVLPDWTEDDYRDWERPLKKRALVNVVLVNDCTSFKAVGDVGLAIHRAILRGTYAVISIPDNMAMVNAQKQKIATMEAQDTFDPIEMMQLKSDLQAMDDYRRARGLIISQFKLLNTMDERIGNHVRFVNSADEMSEVCKAIRVAYQKV